MNTCQVTLYWMIGCGWCEKFIGSNDRNHPDKSEWEKFKILARDNGISTRFIESDEMKAGDAKVRGFPTITIKVRNGEEVQYEGARTADAILEWATNKCMNVQSGGGEKNKYKNLLRQLYVYKLEKYNQKIYKLDEITPKV
jgi:hypothetical protein